MNPDNKHIKKPSDSGVLIHGFFIEGCQFDSTNRVLVPPKPRELFSAMPVIWFGPKTRAECEPPSNGIYQSPVYRIESRSGSLSTIGRSTNFVTVVDLPTQ